MERMKKQTIITLVAALMLVRLSAQEFKLPKTSGRLQINLSGAEIEGHSGNEIIFSSTDSEEETDERAKGLRAINGSGLDDNTGLGINVTDKGAVTEVNQVTRKNQGRIRIKVPRGIVVSFAHDKVINNSTVVFKNVENEIEVSVQYNSVELDNVTGPMTIKTVYGNVEAKFSNNMKGPVSILSVYGHVDVGIPGTTKANISMKTSYGEILASSQLKIEVTQQNDMVKYSNDVVEGKLNGGGLDLILKANYGKIYLRKN